MRGPDPPRRLADRFVVESLLGEGAMGQVFRVYDEHEARVIALKLLKPERTEPGQLQRFKREFRAAARLHHPHCVRSLEFVEDGGLAMITMEHVRGGPLVLHRWERPVDVARLALQLLAGLDHIHGKQLIHRDLKPSNILVEPQDGEPPLPRLTDFGIADLAELSHEDTAVGLVQGSLRYLAPEALESGVVDPRSDLYSLGLVLYALLAGQHPFGGVNRSLRQWLSVHRTGRIKPLSQVRPDVPAPLVDAIQRMCHRRPEERFVDAAAAYDALLEAWSGLPDAGPPPAVPPLTRRPYLAAPTFVGRAGELEALRRLHDDARAGRGPCVVEVVGDGGQGKSRLLRELLVEVLESDTLVFPGTCRAEGGNPYEPLGDLLDALGAVELDGDETPVYPVAIGPPALGLAGPDDPTADVSIGSGPSPSSMVAELRPEAMPAEDALSGRLQAHARWSARLRLLCRKRPLVVLLEDAQWADPPTLQLLAAMVRTMVIARERGDSVRALLVLSHRRSADEPDLAMLLDAAREYGVLTTLDLPPLSGAGSLELLASMLMTRPADVPPSFAQPLLAQADGNPLFLAQMLHGLLGRGLLRRGPDGRFVLDHLELGAARLPGSIDKAIGERAARLSTEHKQILAAAAVLGRWLEVSPLAAVTRLDEPSLLDGVDELVRTGFLEDHERGYRFVHDRIREAIVEAVPPGERRRLHALAAAHLVEHEGELPSAWPVIAHHYEQAEDDARALEYALRAAEQARREHADGAALGFYRAAERVAARSRLPLPEALDEHLGDVHASLGHYPQAVEAYTRRLRGATASRERASLSSKLGLVEFKLGNFRRAIEVLEDVLPTLGLSGSRLPLPTKVWLVVSVLASLLPRRRWRGDVGAAEVAIRTRTLLAECYFMSSDQIATARHSIAAANLARRLGADPESIRALALNGYGMTMYGSRRMGAMQLERARALCREIDPPQSVRCRLHVAEAQAALLRGEVARALEELEDAWQRFGAAASAEARVHVLSAITQALLLTGRDRRRCEHYVRRMQALAEELRDTRLLGVAYQGRGYLLAGEGRLAAAIEPLRRGQRLSQQAGDRRTVQQTGTLLAIAMALDGDLDEALELGRTMAERSLVEDELRSVLCRDSALPIVAAEALRRGRTLPADVPALVRRLLRRRRRHATGLPTTAARFLAAEALWRRSQGLSYDLASPLATAEHLGLHGEAGLIRRIAARFETNGAGRDEPLVLPPPPAG